MSGGVLAAAGTAAVLAAASPADAADAAGAQAPAVRCDARLDVPPTPRGADDVRVGDATFIRLAWWARQGPEWFAPRPATGAVSVKVPVILARGERATLRIAPGDRSGAGLTYGRLRADTLPETRPAVRLLPCTDRPRSFLRGGLVLDGPRCVRLEVRTRRPRARMRILALPFGAPCAPTAPARRR